MVWLVWRYRVYEATIVDIAGLGLRAIVPNVLSDVGMTAHSPLVHKTKEAAVEYCRKQITSRIGELQSLLQELDKDRV